MLYRYDSVLEQDDEILYLNNVLSHLQQQNAQFTGYLFSMLQEADKNTLSTNIQKAQQQWAEIKAAESQSQTI